MAMSEDKAATLRASVSAWDEKSDAIKIAVLHGEVKLLETQVLELASYARSLRLMVQNHTHLNATNQVVFPAAVFEPQTSTPPGYRRPSPLD